MLHKQCVYCRLTRYYLYKQIGYRFPTGFDCHPVGLKCKIVIARILGFVILTFNVLMFCQS